MNIFNVFLITKTILLDIEIDSGNQYYLEETNVHNNAFVGEYLNILLIKTRCGQHLAP